ncbi:hypothetical protein PHYPSEUDO_015258 [Phytophthora pseudosyringae]|uniref:Uncharacterized protein n=1 Tax=Phytophthora pseudosyringae TaxID=221518 RepID=A0A8T1V3C7_9STRA|nr:hypothetical protein PHYPSEUDO_015258 [Phytophthora pseudosyringae]
MVKQARVRSLGPSCVMAPMPSAFHFRPTASAAAGGALRKKRRALLGPLLQDRRRFCAPPRTSEWDAVRWDFTNGWPRAMGSSGEMSSAFGLCEQVGYVAEIFTSLTACGAVTSPVSSV